MINAREQYVDDSVTFGDNVSIDCEKVKIGKEKFEKSGIKDKLKKFKESKTLSDLIKD